MKSILKIALQRFIVIALICVTLLLMMSPAWISIENVKAKHLRNKRKDIIFALANTEEYMLDELWELEEYLDDCDLPHTRSSIKRTFTSLENNLCNLLSKKISLGDLFKLSRYAPKLAVLSENFLALAPDIAEEIIESSGDKIDYEDIENVTDALSEKLYIFKLLTAVFIILFIVAATSIITTAINKLTFFKYIFFALVFAFAVSFIAVSVISANIFAEIDLPKGFEELTLGFTFAPIAAVITALGSLLVPIFFKNKKIHNQKMLNKK